MIVREFLERDTCNKNRLYVEVECIVCSAIFKRQKRQLTDFCCSFKCRALNKGEAILTNCGHCGIELRVSKARINKSKSGLVFCNKECKDLAALYLEDIRPAHYGDGRYYYRDKALYHKPNVCNRCGYDNVLALEVHHVDRNRSNNDLSNLEILCANCHTIEHKMG